MFYFDNFYGKKVLKSTLLGAYECFFTTRDFPLSKGSINDIEEDCEKNRKFLAETLQCKELITTNQVHGDNIELVQENQYFYANTDALISNIPNSVMLLNFADCVPIILYSKKDNTGAIVHAGWRGSLAQITEKTVEKMTDELNINPNDIIAIIGPAIGKCCFETKEDVFLQLNKKFGWKELYTKKSDKYFIDLKLLNKYQLLEKNVYNIDISDYCTCCMSDIFFSYRKENGITARHSAVVKIKGDK